MKHFKHFALTVLVALVGIFSASAHDFSAVNEGSTIYYKITSNDNLTCAVTFRGNSFGSYANEYGGCVVIPSSVEYNGKTYSVTSIGTSAFSGCSSLTSVTIPDCITEIGGWAFDGCCSLVSVVIPSSITSIGTFAFSGCSSLPVEDGIRYAGTYAIEAIDKEQTTYTIKEGTKFIGSMAFYNCKALTNIKLPNSITSIGYAAFHICSSLKSIILPDNVTEIDGSAFSSCSALASINIPSSITTIGSNAFMGCDVLKSVYITDLEAWCRIKFIGSDSNPLFYAHYLYLNNELVTNLVIPNSITSIGEYSFYNCSGMVSVTIPNCVTTIGAGAFSGCSGLVSVTIPNSVTAIGKGSFSGCSGMTSVTVPNSVTEIGDNAFLGCSGLSSVYITDLAAWCKIKFNYNYSNPLYYAHNLYINNELATNLMIPDLVIAIYPYAFYGCSCITSVVMPNSVASISDYAFSGCSSLKSVTIPSGVTSISPEAFDKCGRLNEIHITDISSWMRIDFSNKNPFKYGYALYLDEEKLTDLVVPKGIDIVPAYSFYNCNSLETISLHAGVNTIVQNAFNGCYNVKEIICKSVTPPACGAKVLDGISRSSCTLYVPEESTEYGSTAPWSEFENVVGVKFADTPETCNAPAISIVNGQLHIESSTYGAECYYTIECCDEGSGVVAKNTLIPLNGQYIITAYATAEGMCNSETVCAILLWVNPTLESTNALSMEERKAVVIRTNGNNLQICGTEQGESIQLYSANGMLLSAIKATDDETTVPYTLQRGETYIIKYGDKSVKYQY